RSKLGLADARAVSLHVAQRHLAEPPVRELVRLRLAEHRRRHGDPPAAAEGPLCRRRPRRGPAHLTLVSDPGLREDLLLVLGVPAEDAYLLELLHGGETSLELEQLGLPGQRQRRAPVALPGAEVENPIRHHQLVADAPRPFLQELEIGLIALQDVVMRDSR